MHAVIICFKFLKRSVIEKTQAQNSELDSKFITSEANYAQVNKKLGMAEAGFQTDAPTNWHSLRSAK